MDRVSRYAYLGLTAILLATIVPWIEGNSRTIGGYVGIDYQMYMDATESWLATGVFYRPEQIAGSYPISHGVILYPPVGLWLFVPFTTLPAVLWWAIPLAATALVVWRLRPTFVVWPILALCLVWPPTLVKILTGNPVIWAIAAVAVGVMTAGPAVFALIKPSLFPFALWGIQDRRWWACLLVLALLSLPFTAMWADWFLVITNSQGSVWYSWQEAPMLALPLVAWLGRSGSRLGMRFTSSQAVGAR
jgi:hypothetical protein